MSYQIFVHHGKAHMDELIACALLALHLDESPEAIHRINQQEAAEKVRNKDHQNNDYFIDCGMAFDPENRYFDHHQDGELDCSAMLVFNYYFPDLQDTELHEYLKILSKVDTQGFNSLRDVRDLHESRIYFSFSQDICLHLFESNPLEITKMFIKGLKDKIEFEKKKKTAESWLRNPQNAEVISIASYNSLIYKKPPPENLFKAIRSIDEEFFKQHQISMIYSFDEHNPSVRIMFRTAYGHQSIDFNQCTPKNPIFCHQNGFLLKFIPENNEEWMDLFKKSFAGFYF